MKQSFAYRVLAVDAQRTAHDVAEDSRRFITRPNHEDVRRLCCHDQAISAQLYALARGRVNEAHGWEAIEP
jgi:hypothetical protein